MYKSALESEIHSSLGTSIVCITEYIVFWIVSVFFKPLGGGGVKDRCFFKGLKHFHYMSVKAPPLAPGPLIQER